MATRMDEDTPIMRKGYSMSYPRPIEEPKDPPTELEGGPCPFDVSDSDEEGVEEPLTDLDTLDETIEE